MADEIKRCGWDCEVRAAPAANTFTFIASTEDVARDGDIVKVAGWDVKSFKKNPVILFNHDPSKPIGRAVAVRKETKDPKRLEIDVEFAGLEQMSELAESVKLLARDGFLRAGSVGFIPTEYQDITEDQRTKLGLGRYGRVIKRAELLEFSIVSVPADPGALKMDAEPEEYRKALAHVRGFDQDHEEGFDALERALPGEPAGTTGTASDALSAEEQINLLREELRTIGADVSHIVRIVRDIRCEKRDAESPESNVPTDGSPPGRSRCWQH